MNTTPPPKRKALPRHGSTRRYKDGCRCDPCTAKNTADKKRERDAKARREGRAPTAPKVVPTVTFKPTTAPADEPTYGPIEAAARDALAEYGTDKVAVLRRELAYGIARSMDNPKQGITSTLFGMFRTALSDLIGERAPKDGEADAIRNLMESIGGTRRNRGAAPVPDAAKP